MIGDNLTPDAIQLAILVKKNGMVFHHEFHEVLGRYYDNDLVFELFAAGYLEPTELSCEQAEDGVSVSYDYLRLSKEGKAFVEKYRRDLNRSWIERIFSLLEFLK